MPDKGDKRAARPPEGCPAAAGGLFGPQSALGFETRLVPDLPLPFIPTLIGLRAFDLVSSRVWWEAATNT